MKNKKAIVETFSVLISMVLGYVTFDSKLYSALTGLITYLIEKVIWFIIEKIQKRKFIESNFITQKKEIRNRYNAEKMVNNDYEELDYFVNGYETFIKDISIIFQNLNEFSFDGCIKNEAYNYSGVLNNELKREIEKLQEFDKLLEILVYESSKMDQSLLELIVEKFKELNVSNMEIFDKNRHENPYKLIEEYKKIVTKVVLFLECQKKIMIVYGEAGIGKTNIIFNFVEKRIQNKKKDFIYLCRGISDRNGLSITIGTKKVSIKGVFKYIASKNGVVYFEGINESSYFRSNPPEFLNQVSELQKKYGTKVVYSVRKEYLTSFDHIKDSSSYLKIDGFTGVQVKELLRKEQINLDEIKYSYFTEVLLNNPLYLKIFIETFKESSNPFEISIKEFLKKKYGFIQVSLDNVLKNKFSLDDFYKILLLIVNEELDINSNCIINEKKYLKNELITIVQAMEQVELVEYSLGEISITFDLFGSCIKVTDKINKNLKINKFEVETLKFLYNLDFENIKFSFEISPQELEKIKLENAIYTASTNIDVTLDCLEKEYLFLSSNFDNQYNSAYLYEYCEILENYFVLASLNEELGNAVLNDLKSLTPMEIDIKYLVYFQIFSIDYGYTKYLYDKEISKLSFFDAHFYILLLGSSNRVVRDNFSIKIANGLRDDSFRKLVTEILEEIYDFYIWDRILYIVKHLVFENIITMSEVTFVKMLLKIAEKNIETVGLSMKININFIIDKLNIKEKFNFSSTVQLNENSNAYKELNTVNSTVAFSMSTTSGDWGRYYINSLFENKFINSKEDVTQKYQYYKHIKKKYKNELKKYHSSFFTESYFRGVADMIISDDFIPETIFKERKNSAPHPSTIMNENEFVVYEWGENLDIYKGGSSYFTYSVITMDVIENSLASLFLCKYSNLNQSLLNFKEGYDRHEHANERISKKYQWILLEELLFFMYRTYDSVIDKYSEGKELILKGTYQKKFQSEFDLNFSLTKYQKVNYSSLKKYYSKEKLEYEDFIKLIFSQGTLRLNPSYGYDNTFYRGEHTCYITPLFTTIDELKASFPKKVSDLYGFLKPSLYESDIYSETENSLMLIDPLMHGEYSSYDYRKLKKHGKYPTQKLMKELDWSFIDGSFYYENETIASYEEDYSGNLTLIVENLTLLNKSLNKKNLNLYFIFVGFKEMFEYTDRKKFIADKCTIDIYQYKNGDVFKPIECNVKEYDISLS